MLLSLDWLREFTPYEGTAQELADRLTMLGLEVHEVYDPFAEIRGVVVGHVVEREKHPEADKLSVCKVDVGGPELLTIVCGAPNVAAGQKVPVATVGTTLPGGLKIGKAKLRGVPSMGMICSERELGLTEDHKGIMVLPDTCKPGVLFCESLELDSAIINVDLTPNRGDCLSVLGLAREVAMAYGLPLTLPEVRLDEDAGERAEDFWRIDIPEGELCPLYQARVIRGCTIGQSPDWLKYRLIAMGLRPISNIVDATNYVMLELGQPTHAFDEDRLKGGVVQIKRAADGSTFTTLDGQERKLTGDDLLIWDAERPVALAGVMGGQNSEIHDASRNVLLETAIFRPGTVRKTARRLGLSSDASYRFERGVDQVLSPFACNRVSSLIAELTSGRVLSGMAKAEAKPWQKRVHTFRLSRAADLLGVELSAEFCGKTLTGLGCVVEAKDSTWTVESPSHRSDLEREVDLIEEVGRVYGLDRIPAVLPHVKKSLAEAPAEILSVRNGEFAFLTRIKNWGRGAGLREAINYSFVGHKDLDLLGLPKDGRIDVANPLTEEQNVMRTAVAPGLLQNLRMNVGHGDDGLRLFEAARVFLNDEASDTTANERLRLGMLLHGRRFPGFPWPRDAQFDYPDIKGLVEHLLAFLGLPAPEVKVDQTHSWLEPCVAVSVQGKNIGVMGKLKPSVTEEYKARHAVWMAELDLEAVWSLCAGLVTCFRQLPKFPASWRDMTLVAPLGFPVSGIMEAVRASGQKLLEDVELVDEYKPKDASERNLTFRLTYRAAERTLTDQDVDKAHAAVGKHVTNSCPVKFQAA